MLELTTVICIITNFLMYIQSYILSENANVQRYRMPTFMIFRELTVYISAGGYEIFVCGTHS